MILRMIYSAAMLVMIFRAAPSSAVHQVNDAQPATEAPPSPSPPPPPALTPKNCTRLIRRRPRPSQTNPDVDIHLLPGSDSGELHKTSLEYILLGGPNCTELKDSKVNLLLPDVWKTHVIMACTVTAAIEMVIVIFIVLYWKQIRWTLRKITCPCTNRRRAAADHEPMEREGEQSEAELSPSDISPVHHDFSSSSSSRSPQSGSGRRLRSGSGHDPGADEEEEEDPEEGSIQTFLAPRRGIVSADDNPEASSSSAGSPYTMATSQV